MFGLQKSLSPSSSSSSGFDDDHSAESASSTFTPFAARKHPISSSSSIKQECVHTPKVKLSKRASKKLESRSDNQIDIMFDACHWYDIPCPHPSCYEKGGVRFDDHDTFKLHHEQAHCPRAVNGDIDRAKDSLRWQCPVVTAKTIDGVQQRVRCGKVSNSWYNYAGHITSHKEIGHGWGCALPPEGKRKKTNQTHPMQTDRVVCGKRTSTKHHLLAHMHNVHKAYNVIDTNGRQYNRKKERKSRANSMSTSCTPSSSSAPSSIGKKRKLFSSGSNDIKQELGGGGNMDININHTSLLQMRLPEFPKISMTAATSMPGIPSLLPSLPAPLGAFASHGGGLHPLHPHSIFGGAHPLFPQLIPFHVSGSGSGTGQPPMKKLRADPFNKQLQPLIPDSRGKQCSGKNVKEQYDFLTLLYYAAEIHKGCDKCNACDIAAIDCQHTTHVRLLKKHAQKKKDDVVVVNGGEEEEEDRDGDDENEHDDASDMESSLPSLPSLSAIHSNQSMLSYSDNASVNTINTTNSKENNANASTNTSPISAEGVLPPHLQQNLGNMQSLFKNLLTTNHPFVMDLQQLCNSNNETQTETVAPPPSFPPKL